LASFSDAFSFGGEIAKLRDLYPNQFDHVWKGHVIDIFDRIGKDSTLKVG